MATLTLTGRAPAGRTIAYYLFGSDGTRLHFNPVNEYLSVKLGLGGGVDTAGKLAQALGRASGFSGIDQLLAQQTSAFFEARPEGFEQPFPIGLYVEPCNVNLWDKTESGLYQRRQETRFYVRLSHDASFMPIDPSRKRLERLADPGYEAAINKIAQAVADRLHNEVRGLVALVHDLRGTLEYDDLFLAEADQEGMRRLMHAAHITGIHHIGTVTSGTIGEGQNFLDWVERYSPLRYPGYSRFAICDSLTTAKAMSPAAQNYGQVLVNAQDAAEIRESLEWLSKSKTPAFPDFVHAWSNWALRDTENSFIIDFPPDISDGLKALIILQAQEFSFWAGRLLGTPLSTITKTAFSKGAENVRLYMRPEYLAENVKLSKGSALEKYLSQHRVESLTGRICYFADKYGSPEEIAIGQHALVGFEIDRNADLPELELDREFPGPGRRIPAFIRADDYLTAAEIMSRILNASFFRRQLHNA